MEQEQIQKNTNGNTRFLSVWGVAAAIVALVFLFYGWKSWRLDAANQTLQLSITNLQTQIQALAPGSTEQFLKKQEEAMKRAEKYRTNWSVIMEQLTALETPSVRFSKLTFADGKVSASCQATSWNSLSAFIESLKQDSRIDTIRILSTAVLSPPVSGATQTAEVTFHFTPTNNENE